MTPELRATIEKAMSALEGFGRIMMLKNCYPDYSYYKTLCELRAALAEPETPASEPEQCFCLGCDPKQGEIGRECINPHKGEKVMKPTEAEATKAIQVMSFANDAITSAAERMNIDPLELATALQGGVIAELYGALDQLIDDMNPKDDTYPTNAGICEAAWDRAKTALAKIPQPKEQTK